MKAAAFTYARPTSVVNALELLAAHGDRAKVLSGGQSLMPAMNLRLMSPDLVVDIGGLAELRGITIRRDALIIGALTRHVELLRSPEVAEHAPLLREAVTHVAHPAIRNRGTIGGSLAHADPASELPACTVALDAAVVVRGPDGERRIAAREFFKGIYETALSANELLVAIEIPLAGEGSRFFFQEYARRHGDYAIIGLAAHAVVKDGRFAALQLAFFAVEDRPLLVEAARKLINVSVTPASLDEASAALDDELDPQQDQQATPAMRRHLAKVLLRHCVATLLARPELETGAAG
ncbi:xanthine dehydrogenase family protein subunit M [Bradyrhizobium genosp. L]|uniref:FAD binding domain-containing protein n=1 Tax=Bradyrhizobium genosp. L TaxID=83637 RepID=UPI0018A2739B|nr:xanthine dehydrogenase family protein subunit M [Bradyrhizobium genosp. L]QPF83050.1 xanthine dehydrogenase family protein subunit M [Bradyrhizobium genosp. L]